MAGRASFKIASLSIDNGRGESGRAEWGEMPESAPDHSGHATTEWKRLYSRARLNLITLTPPASPVDRKLSRLDEKLRTLANAFEREGNERIGAAILSMLLVACESVAAPSQLSTKP